MPDYIKIRTARNVEIEYRIASLSDRVVGRIIDSLIWMGYIFFITMVAAVSRMPLLMSFLIIPAFFYTFIFERFNNGQTPGKNIVMTRVVSLNGESVTTGMYFLRWILLLADARIASGIIGLVSILGTEYGQRLGDLAAGTTVVSLKKKASLENAAYRRIPDNYIPNYETAASLTDSDIHTIKKVIRSRSENRNKLISMTAQKLEENYGMVRNASALTMLRNVVKDYTYYQKMAHRQEWGASQSVDHEENQISDTPGHSSS